MTESKDLVKSVTYLRALAAIAVCVIHYRLNTGISVNRYVDYVIENGHQGVTVFFVISGFILPLSLYRKNYNIRGFFTFLLKRSVRVDPPYWFSIVLLFTIGFYPITMLKWDTLFFHITYLIPFIKGQEWFTSVYWTLSVEFQYYVILGLIFPILMKLPKYLTVTLLVVGGIYCLHFTIRWLIVTYMYQFIFGYIAFMGYTNLIKKPQFIALLIFYTLLICAFKSIVSGCVPLITVIAIVYFKPVKTEPISYFLGKISYSIYLIHIPIMACLGHLLAAQKLSAMKLCVIYTAVIIPAAYLMYILIEIPSLRYSKSIVISSKGSEACDQPLP